MIQKPEKPSGQVKNANAVTFYQGRKKFLLGVDDKENNDHSFLSP